MAGDVGGNRECWWSVVAEKAEAGEKIIHVTYIMRLIFRGNFFTFVRVMDFKSQG